MFEIILGAGFFGMLVLAILWWLPIIFILSSNKTTGIEKTIWLLLIFFFSWFSWILYALLAPVAKK